MKFFKSSAVAACVALSVMSCNYEAAKQEDSKTQDGMLTDIQTVPPPNQESPIELNSESGSPIISNEEEKNKSIETGNQFSADTVQPKGHTKISSVTNTKANPDWDKKIIKTASLNVEVKDFKIFNHSLRDKVQQSGGYIAQEEQNQSEYKIENIVTIKVPVEQFNVAISQLTSDTEKLLEKKITSQDVTAEVVDIKSRMEAKRQVRLRYLDLLKQAKTMEDILNVQSEINSIQEDIESAAGRTNFLSQSSAYSTIHLTFFQVLNPSAKDINEPAFGTKVWQSFQNGWGWMGEVLIGMISIWPLIFFAFICWLAFKKWHVNKIRKTI